MTITVSGLGSGLDYDSWITQLVAAKQKDIDAVSAKVTAIEKKSNTLSTIQSDYKDLLAAIQTFTDALSTTDLFNQKAATSSSSAVTASVSSNANTQNVSIEVESLATGTTAQSTYPVASYVDSNTKMSDISGGSFKAGSFTLYVDGKKNQITLNSGSTMGDVLTAINGTKDSEGNKVGGITGISANLVNGKLSITADSSSVTLSVGATTDTSNFAKVMSLASSTVDGVTTYSSSKSVFDTKSNTAITSNPFSSNANGDSTSIWAGTFSINGTTFTIDDTTTMDSLIAKINKSDAGVTAAWDPNAGKMTLAAKEQGAISIDIEAGTSNFTDVMGFTTSDWTNDVDEEGKTTHTLNSTKLNTAAQTLGTNAILKINGTEITSSSNTVTSDVSGIAGLTLTLNAKTTSAETVSISQDASAVTKAINTLVSAYNKTVSASDDATTTDGVLYGETILKSVRNTIRKLVSSSVDGEDSYKTLASIGISTGAFSTNVKADVTQLKIDSDALTAALKENPSAVKTLLVGNSDMDGVLDKLKSVIKNATDSVNGYFVKREASYTKEESNLNKKVTKMTTDLATYKANLETKFSAMDKLISSLQKSASIFDSYFNKSNSNN